MNHRTDTDRPEDLDDLLRAFFLSELPSPWPRLSRTRPPSPPPAPWAAASSRLALAASIAVLLAAGYFVADRLAGAGVRGFSLEQPKAERVKPGDLPMPMAP